MDRFDSDGDEFSGVLDIFVHNARNIHNICIYENQDVYAKFSLTYNPDETFSTRIVKGGGKNPDFNENLRIKITHPDAVLKCEIWMLSRARNYLEDQLLGFALVPISTLIGKLGKSTQNYTLSSTDLFHSPAGTVQLTLSLNRPLSESSTSTSSITSEVVLLDPKKSQVLDLENPVEFSSIEFPDINVVKENQQMVSDYFSFASLLCSSGSRSGSGSGGVASFLHLGSSPPQPSNLDCEMTAYSSEDNYIIQADSISPNGSSIQNSGFFSSTTTTLSDDRNSADSIEKKNGTVNVVESANSNNVISVSTITTTEVGKQSCTVCPETPTSKKEREDRDEKEEMRNKEGELATSQFGQVFSSPLGNINLEDDQQSTMQQQIVDMYMKSMQQFTESLAKMKLPMELDHHEAQTEDNGDIIQCHSNNHNKLQLDKKKDGSRVFYGSRAFF